MEGTRLSFWLTSDAKARVERLALQRGVTQGVVLRDALAEYFVAHSLSEAEKEHSRLAQEKRFREMAKAKPKDVHDGAMFVITVIETAEKGIIEWKKKGIFQASDYNYFLKMVEANKEVAETYAGGDLLIGKLEEYIHSLESRMEAERKTRDADR